MIERLINRAAASDEVLAVLIAAGLSFLGWIAVRIITGRAKVAWSFSHQHAFLLPNANAAPILAYTKEMWVQNIGRVFAEEVEVILPGKPGHFDVWPQRRYQELTNPDGSFVIKFDNLNSREWVTISMFQTASALSNVANVRWRGGVARQLPMGPQRIWPQWYLHILRGFLLFGVFSFIYFLVRII